MASETRLKVARLRAQRHREMLSTASEVNDRTHGFTREDMDVLLWETAQMTPVAADDLRMSMIVQLRTHHRRYGDAITGRQKAYPDLTGMLVAELIRGWERYRTGCAKTNFHDGVARTGLPSQLCRSRTYRSRRIAPDRCSKKPIAVLSRRDAGGVATPMIAWC